MTELILYMNNYFKLQKLLQRTKRMEYPDSLKTKN